MATPTPTPSGAAPQSCVSAASPLIFMHNPKTGGMSMFTAFSALWGTDIADLYDISARTLRIAEQAVQDRRKVLYSGHFAFGLHEWLDRPAYYASVLREPVSRIVSLYHYCQPMLKAYRGRLHKAGGDLGKLLQQPNVSDFYLDFMPWLTGEMNAETFFASPSAELDNGMVRRFSGFGLNRARCPDSALEQAKQNIEQYFSVVGLLERYPETLQLMASTFGLPTLNQNHVNANRAKKAEAPLDDAIMAKIRDMNRLDTALYDWVSARFDQQLAHPRAAVQVPGKARTDYEFMPLWRAVGQSPLREAAMTQKGVPKPPKPGTSVLCTGITGAGVNPKMITTDIETALILPNNKLQKGPYTRMFFEPRMARNLMTALQDALAAYEKKHGAIQG